MKNNKFLKIIKKISLFICILFFAEALTGCNKKIAKECIREFSAENELTELTFEIKDEAGNLKTSNNLAREYILKEGKFYYLNVNLLIANLNVPDEAIISVLISAKENIKSFDVEEANTSKTSINDSTLKLDYTSTGSVDFEKSFSIIFEVNEETDYIDDSFVIYAISDSKVYLNNFDYFAYSISDYFGTLLGYDGTVSYSYIYFGKAPQTHVDDSRLIKQLNKITSTNEDGYYEYEGNEYAKLIQSEANIGKKYSDGKLVTSGLAYFKVEPILWRIMSQDEKKYRLLSVYSLYLYDSNMPKEAYKTLFSKTERKLIGNKKIECITEDELNDAKNGFSSNASRISLLSDYAIANGVNVFEENKCKWLNRNNPNDSDYFVLIDENGECESKKNSNESVNNCGFRPVITISKGGYIYKNSIVFTIIGSILLAVMIIVGICMVCDNCEEEKLWIFAIPVLLYLGLLFFTPLNWWILLIVGPIGIGIDIFFGVYYSY